MFCHSVVGVLHLHHVLSFCSLCFALASCFVILWLVFCTYNMFCHSVVGVLHLQHVFHRVVGVLHLHHVLSSCSWCFVLTACFVIL